MNKVNTTEGVIAHRVDQLRKLYPNIDGSGIKIGVISDSVDHLEVVQNQGYLPLVTVLDNIQGTGEGTAMLEIIYTMAPGAELYFATGSRSETSFAENIINLANAGCSIIVDDIFYITEPAFEDGIIAQAINQVATNGVAYFSAAGDFGNFYSSQSQTWEGNYNSSGINSTTIINGTSYLDYHVYSTGSPFNQVSGDNSSSKFIVLQWADLFSSPEADYDLFLIDSNHNIVASSTSYVLAYEIVEIPKGSGYSIVIARYSGPQRFIRVMIFESGTLQFSTNGAISGHSTADGAFAIGAIGLQSESFFQISKSCHPLNPQPYSSDGPRRIFFENGVAITPNNFLSTGGKLRAKPDFVAVDGVSTSTPGYETFYGTSASVSHAASLVALILSISKVNLSVLKTLLFSSVIDVSTPGFDDVSGAGVLDAIFIFEHFSSNLNKYCGPTPCLNGGSPSGPPLSTCICIPGFSGHNCEVNNNECESNPCINGGKCLDGINSYSCQCPDSFTGINCQILPAIYSITTKTNNDPNSGTIGTISMLFEGNGMRTFSNEIQTNAQVGQTFISQRILIEILPLTSIYITLNSTNDDWTYDSILIQINNNTYIINGTKTIQGGSTSRIFLIPPK